MDQLQQYKQFVRDNPERIKKYEDILRMVALILPTARFGEYAELATETSYSVLGLIGFFHDSLIADYSNSIKDNMRKLIKTGLTLLSNTEIVLEMLATKLMGNSRKWQLVYYLEILKALARLYLLMKTQFGTVLQMGGQFDGKKITKSIADAKADESLKQDSESSSKQVVSKWIGKRSGKSIQLPDKLSKYVNENLTENTQLSSPSTEGDDKDTVTTPNEVLGLVGEVLHIVRPVIHVMAIRASSNKKAWSPWLLSLLTDLLSARCSAVAAAPPTVQDQGSSFQQSLMKLWVGPTNATPSTAVGEELRRRKLLFAYYLMRSPAYDAITVKFVAQLFSPLEKISFLKSFAKLPLETLDYYHRHHFYTSCS